MTRRQRGEDTYQQAGQDCIDDAPLPGCFLNRIVERESAEIKAPKMSAP
jgi:hypothetical protein